MKRRTKIWPLSLLLCLAALLAIAGPAWAHAELVRSTPAAGAVLAKFPTTVVLEFSEDVDPVGMRARLLNEQGQVVAAGQPALDPQDKTIVRIQLPSQPDGLYSLAWSVNSADDAHETEGTIAFSVGAASPRASLLPPPGAPDQSTALPAAPEILLRWLGYLAISLLVGSALFGVLIWRPVYRRSQAAGPAAIPVTGDSLAEVRDPANLPDQWDEFLSRVIRRIGLGAAILAILGLIAQVIYHALQALADPSVGSFWLGLDESLGHHGSSLVWVNLGVLMLLALLVNDLPGAGDGFARSYWEVVVIGGVVAFTSALVSHNAALGGWVPIAVDWLHLMSMSAWLGGLLPLALLLIHARRSNQAVSHGEAAAARELTARVLHRFSRMAVAAVILIGLSGLYSAYYQVQTWQALVSTRYGQAILVKTALFAVLIILGAVNQFELIPRVSRSGSGALRRISQTVRVEWVLGLLLLLVVGGLVSLSPAYQALQADLRAGYHQSYRQGAVTLDLRVAPASPGDNEFGVDVSDHRPGADQAATVVLLRIQAADGSSGLTQLQADHTIGDRYTTRGSYLSHPTAWQIDVILRKPGFEDVQHRFTVDLAKMAAQRNAEK